MAATLLVLLGPLMVMIAIAVRHDGRKAVHRSRRIGRGGRPFVRLSFRTMATDAESPADPILLSDPAARRAWQLPLGPRDDSRVTPIGAVLRRTGMDALPQLLNVLAGEMSLIGPSPILESEIPAYGPAFAAYAALRPGLIGLDRRVTGENGDDADRAAPEARYIRQWTPWLDASIALRGVVARLARARGRATMRRRDQRMPKA